MFGEETIYGRKSVYVDEKNRIRVPRFTGCEKGDKLLIIDEKEFLSVYSEEKFKDRENELYKRLYESESEEEKRKYKLEILYLYASVIKKAEITAGLKINISNPENKLKSLIEDNRVLCVGANDHLIIKGNSK